jgi:hypothetical protein
MYWHQRVDFVSQISSLGGTNLTSWPFQADLQYASPRDPPRAHSDTYGVSKEETRTLAPLPAGPFRPMRRLWLGLVALLLSNRPCWGKHFGYYIMEDAYKDDRRSLGGPIWLEPRSSNVTVAIAGTPGLVSYSGRLLPEPSQ